MKKILALLFLSLILFSCNGETKKDNKQEKSIQNINLNENTGKRTFL